MYIQKLEIEGFRGVESLSLELQPNLNVLVGMNGTGKSTILDSSAILLSWLVNRIKQSGTSGRPISEYDIKNEKSSAKIELTLNKEVNSFKWTIGKTRKGYHTKDAFSSLNDLSEEAKQIQSEITLLKGKINLPLFAYYPVNRSVLDIPLRIKDKHSFSLLSAYDDSLTSGANFRTFFEWFRQREDLENENRKFFTQLFEIEKIEYPDPQLEAVRDALTQFMPDFKNLSVRRNPLRMEVDKLGNRLIVNQLSDGEKCLMAMVGDLARRMAIANPLKENPLEGEGVVLIDEIELHLHPKWQRMVIPNLAKVFPNCQFIISTHSPHVITHVKPENLFLLSFTTEGIKFQRPTDSYGLTVERILEDLMELETTRPIEIMKAINKIYQKIDLGEFDEVRKLIATLETEIKTDPEMVKAKILLKRKELIGK